MKLSFSKIVSLGFEYFPQIEAVFQAVAAIGNLSNKQRRRVALKLFEQAVQSAPEFAEQVKEEDAVRPAAVFVDATP